eukprot:TRINITY_DN83848_c0_g1_i1.p1 TRINITY_DN83848_c0_g1~~TRINITY_DN83848_c0_g1_i1.p1  ORF type:complete len:359 (+),score=72.88 TRINITY_DN83848_c0_g1_i1:95-1171(+)
MSRIAIGLGVGLAALLTPAVGLRLKEDDNANPFGDGSDCVSKSQEAMMQSPTVQAALGASGTRDLAQALGHPVRAENDVFGMSAAPPVTEAPAWDDGTWRSYLGEAPPRVESTYDWIEHGKADPEVDLRRTGTGNLGLRQIIPLGRPNAPPPGGSASLADSAAARALLTVEQRKVLKEQIDPVITRAQEVLPGDQQDPPGSLSGLMTGIRQVSNEQKQRDRDAAIARQGQALATESETPDQLVQQGLQKAKSYGMFASSLVEMAAEREAPHVRSPSARLTSALAKLPEVRQAILKRPSLFQELDRAVKHPREAALHLFADADLGRLEQEIMADLPPPEADELDALENELEIAARLPQS